jgi:DNA-binding HxlR family transcriptional regulator
MTTTTSSGQHERVPTEPPEATALEEAVAQVGDRWTLLVVNSLLDGPRRFNELLGGMTGLAPNVLSKRLRHLEVSGLVVATPYTRRPPRFDYRLTATGAELASALRLLAHWGSTGHPDVVPIHHSACGTPVEARWYCPTCARLVEGDETGDTRFV